MIKKILIASLFLLIILGALAGTKVLQIRKMIAQGESMVIPPAVVSAANATSLTTMTSKATVGSVTAVQGVTLTAETPGRVVKITFESGTKVGTGDILVQLDTTEEMASLRSAQASETLARINVDRLQKLVPQQASPQAEFDKAIAELQQAQAQVESLKAVIVKKTVRAPFAGTLGIRKINLGQIVSSSDAIVTLHRLDNIYVEFQLPQQDILLLQPGLDIRVQSDVLPGKAVGGKLTVIEPVADSATRMVKMQAAVENFDELLRPGMFVQVSVLLAEQKMLTLVPATSVLYAAYGDSVFVIESHKDKSGADELVLRQQFVKIGERPGDFVAIDSGISPGVTIVSTGVFKYQNGQSVVIDNALAPSFSLAPNPGNS